MGIDASSAVFLAHTKVREVDFSRTAMIGRQSFWPGKEALSRVLACLGIQTEADLLLAERYAEEFLRRLGADEIVSFDVSDYESAAIVHDMNLPIPPEWHKHFSCVHDGGTTEHAFNIPQALKTAWKWLRLAGISRK